MRFKLLCGTHSEGGKTYTKGQVVKSNHQLDQIFKHKFLWMDEPEEGEEPVLEVAVIPDNTPTASDEIIAKHHGRGRWSIYNVTTGTQLTQDWMSKDEAIELLADYTQK